MLADLKLGTVRLGALPGHFFEVAEPPFALTAFVQRQAERGLHRQIAHRQLFGTREQLDRLVVLALTEIQRGALDEGFDAVWVQLDGLVVQLRRRVIVPVLEMLLGLLENRFFLGFTTRSTLSQDAGRAKADAHRDGKRTGWPQQTTEREKRTHREPHGLDDTRHKARQSRSQVIHQVIHQVMVKSGSLAEWGSGGKFLVAMGACC